MSGRWAGVAVGLIAAVAGNGRSVRGAIGCGHRSAIGSATGVRSCCYAV